MTETHDRQLGGALRELDVPEHRPNFEVELERQIGSRPPKSRSWILAAAAALAVGIAASLALFVPRGTDVASAAEVREAVSKALASAQRISGVFVNQEDPVAGNRWRFTFDASGSFRITGLTKNNPSDLAYDAGENVESYSDLGLFVRRTGLAPGWPDAAAAGWVMRRDIGSVVAALAATPDADVDEVAYDGRPAWRLRTSTSNAREELEITVDRATGLPVRGVRLVGGRSASEWRIEGLAVDTGPSVSYRVEPKRGQDTTAYDMGFRRTSVGAVRDVVGYAPLVPSWLPPGYDLAETATAASSRPTGDEQRQNPPSRNVVSLRYQRGLDQIVVTTRVTGSDPSLWGDPVIGSSVRSSEPERVEFDSGALRGHAGELVIDPNSVPHVWAIAGELVVTIAGNADREELLRIARSLER